MNNNEIKLNSTDKQEILNNYPISKSKEDQLWETVTKNYEGIDIGNELSVGLIVSGTILALGAPIAGSAAIVLGTMLPLFWPSDAEGQWASLINYAGQLIDNKLNKYALNDAISKLKGLKEVIEDYNNYRTKFIDPNEKNKPTREEVFNKFSFAHSTFIRDMPEFSIDSYEITLLPAYALAANMHLLLMRDGILYANKIRVTRDTRLNGSNLYQTFLTRKSQYVNHCLDFYNKGLSKFPKPITKVADFKKVNDYKLYMTINVLDIISLFSNYDLKKYPGHILPKTDLTREVFTSPLNYDSKQLNADYMQDDLESELTSPHFFRILREFKAEIVGEEWKSAPGLNLGPDDRKDRPFISGTRCDFSFINDDNTIREGLVQGAFGWYKDCDIESIPIDISKDRDNRIYQVTTSHFGDTNTMAVLQKIYLHATIGGLELGSYQITGGYTNRYLTPPCISKVSGKIKIGENNNYSHNLSNMLSYNNGIKFQTSILGWTHAAVDRENKIKKDTITQIAAIKGIREVNQATVVEGLGFTGGDLVNIDNGKTLTVKIKHDFKYTKYKIRLRYAARYNTLIDFKLGKSTFSVPVKSTFANDESPLNLKYEYFDYVDITETLYENLQLEDVCTVLCKGSNIIIDKIEFIPESIASKL